MSNDPAARRRELLAVLAICRAQARGARERAIVANDPPGGVRAAARDSGDGVGTAVARLGSGGCRHLTVANRDGAAVTLPGATPREPPRITRY
jgi:hypothetical protein